MGAMIRETSLQGVGLSWAHTEVEEGIPAENSISKGAELRICLCIQGL